MDKLTEWIIVFFIFYIIWLLAPSDKPHPIVKNRPEPKDKPPTERSKINSHNDVQQ